MNSKIITNEEEAIAFYDKIVSEDNTAYVETTESGSYHIKWVKNKKYTTFDNKEFNDQVWMTLDGELILVQDLTEAHAKNILRMLIRKKQEFADTLNALLDAEYAGLVDIPKTLH